MVFASVAMLFSAIFFSFLIWLVYKRFWVRIDPKLEEVIHMLPGLNCAACGFANCQMLAEAVISGKDVICPVLDRQKQKEIYRFLGRELTQERIYKAIVLCGAHDNEKTFSAQYGSVRTCKIANIYSAYQACQYGCLGYGDCVKVCPVSAIEIKEGLACIDIDKCIGCGLCVKACPRNIIILVPQEGNFIPLVACSNKDKPAEVKAVCKVGCIGCGLCLKLGPEEGFKLEANLAKVSYEKVREHKDVEAWRKAAQKCPMRTIQIKSSRVNIEVGG